MPEKESELPPPLELSQPDAKPKKQRYYTRGRIFRRALLLFGAYLGLCAGIAWITVAPRHGGLTATPQQVGMPYENVTFRSADGTKLSGWFVPSPGKPKGVIVFSHGVDGNRDSLLEAAKMLNRHGYAALLFDFRARGESEGAHSTLGWKETDDLLAAINMVSSRPELRGVPLGLMGHSMGGAVSLMAAARNRNVRAVIVESPYAQLDHAVHNHFKGVFGPLSPIFEKPCRWFGERLIGRSAAEISPVRDISRIAPNAVLIIADSEDTLCPASETHALYEACGEPKSLWTVLQAGHVQAINRRPEEFQRRIVEFFDNHLSRRN